MPSERALIAFALGVFVLIGSPAVFHAHQDGAPGTDTVDEEFTPDPGTWQELEKSRLDNTGYEPTVTVKDNNGDEVNATAYEWNSSFEEGTIKPTVGGELDGEPSATISYTYHEPDDEQSALFDSIGQLITLPAFFLLVIGVLMLLAGARVFL